MGPGPEDAAVVKDPGALDSLVRAAADVRYITPAAFDYALACGDVDEARLALKIGAIALAEAEFARHREGSSLAILDRFEQILTHALEQLPQRHLEAIAVEYIVLAPGDEQTPPTVLYAHTSSTGADWADQDLP